MKVKVMFVFMVGLFISCSQSDIGNEEECTPAKLDCLNYDISYDTLLMIGLTSKIEGVSYNQNLAGGIQNLLGSIGFDGEIYNFFFHVKYEDTIFLEYKYRGTFNYTHDRLIKSSLLEDAYIKYAELNLYDIESGDSIKNIMHRFHCGTGSHRFIFEKDDIEFKAYFE